MDNIGTIHSAYASIEFLVADRIRSKRKDCLPLTKKELMSILTNNHM